MNRDEDRECAACNGAGVLGTPGAPCGCCKFVELGRRYKAAVKQERAAAGLHEITMTLGGAPVPVRYTHEAAMRGHGDHPDIEESAEMRQVCINGVWIDCEWFCEEWVGEQDILIVKKLAQHRKDDAQSRADDRAEERMRDWEGA